MEDLQIFSNQLSGNIPSELGSLLTKMTPLHLDANALVGSIPTDWRLVLWGC